MRRQYFWWTYLVLAIVLFVYGGYSIIYNLDHQKDIAILGLVFFIFGAMMLLFYLYLLIVTLYRKKKAEEKAKLEKVEEIEVKQEVQPEPKLEVKEVKKETTPKKEYHVPKNRSRYDNDATYVRSSRSYGGGTAYIKLVGSGPVLRVTGSEILDMRNNTYYTIEGNMVKRNGSGPVFEISGNRIRSAFGGYLYEISGSNVNKVYGGYFASISGGYIQKYDLSEKYEVSGSLGLAQQLAVVALLFGEY